MEAPTNENLRPSAANQRKPVRRCGSAVTKRKKKRGAARPGAGPLKATSKPVLSRSRRRACRRAFKPCPEPAVRPSRRDGRSSTQFAAIGAVMASNPKLRDTLLALAERYGLKQAKAEEIGWDVLLRFLKHADDIAAGRTKKPFLPDGFQAPPD